MNSAISRDALTDRAHELLRDRIIDGRLAPGERLQIDRLSKELGVSHTPVREALNRLASERLVSLEPFKGFSVTPLLDATSLRLLFEARRVIELGALREAVGRVTERNLEDLSLLVEKLEGVTQAPDLDIVAYNELDAAFHRATVAPCPNVYLLNAYDDLRVHVQIARYYRDRPVTDMKRAQVEHRAILKALVAGDSDALVAAADAHITTVCDRLAGDDTGANG